MARANRSTTVMSVVGLLQDVSFQLDCSIPRLTLIMISVAYSDIPSYLHNGAFYQSLNADDGAIQIPQEYCVATDDVASNADLVKLLKVTAFWGLNRIPTGVVRFCHKMEASSWSSVVEAEDKELGFAQDLLAIFKPSAEINDRVVKAIELNRIEVVEVLIPAVRNAYGAPEMAALHGRLDILQLMLKHNHPWDEDACTKAAEGGHLDCLKFLHENDCPWDDRVHMVAAQRGHLNCIQYAREKGLRFGKHALYSAAHGGYLDIIHYLLAQKRALSDEATDNAAMMGHFECLRVLLEAGCPMPEGICGGAALGGHVECLALAHQKGAPIESWMYHTPAENGHVKVIEYMHRNGIEWDYKTPELAAQHGHIDVLRYALDNDCPYEDVLINHATRAVHDTELQCLRYLVEERELPIFDDGGEFIAAFGHANHRAMQYLINVGAVFLPAECTEDIMSGFGDALTKSLRCKYSAVDKSQFDASLLECMVCAASNGWNIDRHAAAMVDFVRANDAKLPLCVAYVSTLSTAAEVGEVQGEEGEDEDEMGMSN